MKFIIRRKAVLMEDEGYEHYMGAVEADSAECALNMAAAQFGQGYFYRADFVAIPCEDPLAKP